MAMKDKLTKSLLLKNLAVLTVICVLVLTMSACGNRMSGEYVPENPEDENVIFTSMDFDGKTVHLEFGGSNIGLEYSIKDNTFEIKGNMTLTLDGKEIPTSYSFSKIDDESFKLGDIVYVLDK